MSEFPKKFEILATYNAEVCRGLVHREEYKKVMRILQAEYNQWIVEQFKGKLATDATGPYPTGE